MRGALAVALGGLALTLALGIVRTWFDTRQEMHGALALTALGERLPAAARQGREPTIELLRQADADIRHLQFELRDERGGRLYASTPRNTAWPAWWPRFGAGAPAGEAAQTVSWRVDRGNEAPWSLVFAGRPQDEEAEALSTLGHLFALMAASCAAMLLVMHLVIRRSFRPLSSLLAAIGRLERADRRAVHDLPAMPARELDAIAASLRHLAGSLHDAEDARRVLAHQVHSLQEDERAKLAAELHDEFGQRLTALRVDAAWLQRQVHEGDPRHAVIAGMGEQVARIQDEVRSLLSRLRPLGPAALDDDARTLLSLARMRTLIESLVAGWSRDGGPRLALRCRVRREGEVARAPEARTDLAWMSEPLLPRDVALAIYRVSQEALTNVARHSGATQAWIELGLVVTAGAPSAPIRIEWRCSDDGVGLPDPSRAMHQGSGLAGMRERLWSIGGEFGFGEAVTHESRGVRSAGVADARGEVMDAAGDAPGPARAGLVLWARWPIGAWIGAGPSPHGRSLPRADAEPGDPATELASSAVDATPGRGRGSG